MARVWLGSQTVSPVQDSAGNRVVGAAVTIKNLDGSNATHWSAKTGGTSSTAAITTNSRGLLDRWIDPGTYTYSTSGITTRSSRLLGGWGHRLRGRWENTSGTMLFSAGRTATGNTTSGSNVVTTVTATGSSLSFAVGMPINGTGIPADTYVIGVNLDGANTLRLGTAAGVA
jgi:hypothetical protein